MQKSMDPELFRSELLSALQEAFDTHHGIFLDKGTSLLETLDALSAEQASSLSGGRKASIAAHVAHVTFYLEVVERFVITRERVRSDWGAIWKSVGAVTPEEWSAMKSDLREAYGRVSQMLRAVETWDEDAIGGGLGIVVHTAYHLGAIRQAVQTLS